MGCNGSKTATATSGKPEPVKNKPGDSPVDGTADTAEASQPEALAPEEGHDDGAKATPAGEAAATEQAPTD